MARSEKIHPKVIFYIISDIKDEYVSFLKEKYSSEMKSLDESVDAIFSYSFKGKNEMPVFCEFLSSKINEEKYLDSIKGIRGDYFQAKISTARVCIEKNDDKYIPIQKEPFLGLILKYTNCSDVKALYSKYDLIDYYKESKEKSLEGDLSKKDTLKHCIDELKGSKWKL